MSEAYSSPEPAARGVGYLLRFIAALASLIALFSCSLAACAVYLAATFDPLGDTEFAEKVFFPAMPVVILIRVAAAMGEGVAVRIAAVVFTLFGLTAAAVAWLCWWAAKRRMNDLRRGGVA